jgi:dUTP pyrophosphatase
MSMKAVRVKVKRLPHGKGLPLPAYQSAGAAGLDLLAAVPNDAPVSLVPGQWATIPTGIAIALPRGIEGQVRPRSGLAGRDGISVLNSPGTIDSDYRGELQVILVNFGAKTFLVSRGSRIAQLVVTPVLHARLVEHTKLEKTRRGTRGFGSTGKRVIDKRAKKRP